MVTKKLQDHLNLIKMKKFYMRVSLPEISIEDFSVKSLNIISLSNKGLDFIVD